MLRPAQTRPAPRSRGSRARSERSRASVPSVRPRASHQHPATISSPVPPGHGSDRPDHVSYSSVSIPSSPPIVPTRAREEVDNFYDQVQGDPLRLAVQLLGLVDPGRDGVLGVVRYRRYVARVVADRLVLLQRDHALRLTPLDVEETRAQSPPSPHAVVFDQSTPTSRSDDSHPAPRPLPEAFATQPLVDTDAPSSRSRRDPRRRRRRCLRPHARGTRRSARRRGGGSRGSRSRTRFPARACGARDP